MTRCSSTLPAMLFPADTIDFHGGAGSGVDSASVSGGQFASIVHKLTNATDGQTLLQGLGSTNISTFNSFGLEPFLLDVDSVARLTIEVPAGPTDAVARGCRSDR